MKSRQFPGVQQIHNYLEAHGWHECDPITPVGVMFEFERLSDDNQQITVFVPAHTEFDDYPLRVSDIVDTLAPVERRSKDAVWADLLAENAPAATTTGNLPAVSETSVQPQA